MLFVPDCPRIEFAQPLKPALNESEKQLVCGKSEFHEWKHIPLYQISIHLKAMLQQRGFYFAKIEERTRENKVLVDPGSPLLIDDVEVTGIPFEIDIKKKWSLQKKPWSKKNLSNLMAYLRRELGVMGFPCPVIEQTLDPDNAQIRFIINPGQREIFPEIERDKLPDLKENVFSRFTSFKAGDVFNQEELELTDTRIGVAGIVSSSDFGRYCPKTPEDRFRLIHKISSGKPRLISAGFGLNSESGLLAQISLRHARLDSYASTLHVLLRGSFRQQFFSTAVDWYTFPNAPSVFLRPEVIARRIFEPHQIYQAVDVRLGPHWRYDFNGYNLRYQTGPAASAIRLERGDGPKRTNVLTFDLGANVSSHDFELYQSDPRSGQRFDISGRISKKDWISEISFQEYTLRSEHLWNFGDFHPPRYVLGLRSGLSTTLVQDSLDVLYKLPAPFRHYLGGSQSLRGFSRNELPTDDFGALNTVFAGTELRIAIPFYPDLQIFTFADFGMLGKRAAELELPLFFSPGFGSRWRSPIGVIRGTAGHGFLFGHRISDQEKLSHWQFFLALGEEF